MCLVHVTPRLAMRKHRSYSHLLSCRLSDWCQQLLLLQQNVAILLSLASVVEILLCTTARIALAL
jgi:hypothetical protein